MRRKEKGFVRLEKKGKLKKEKIIFLILIKNEHNFKSFTTYAKINVDQFGNRLV